MHREGPTLDRSEFKLPPGGGERLPGLLRVFGGDGPMAQPLPFGGEALELGRGSPGLDPAHDKRMSRRHARVHFDGRRFWVTDLGSRTGTDVDGERAPPDSPRELREIVRMGDSLFVPSADLSGLVRRGVVTRDGFVRGPTMQALLDEVARAAELGFSVHLQGESGTGKEGVARAFHEGGGGRGPFVAVNCAAIARELAEAELFGAKRGAYSGSVADRDGYLVAADGGTLFLDEVAELDRAVQAKLLRVLQEREVQALGAARPRPVRFRLCSASHRDLRDEVASGRMREDLYFRLGRPELMLPPLRERPEEIAYLLEGAVRGVQAELGLHVSLVEACLLRPWPGNVRELLVEARAAAQAALLRGAERVEARHLSPRAGTAFRVANAGRASSFEPAAHRAPPAASAPAPASARPLTRETGPTSAPETRGPASPSAPETRGPASSSAPETRGLASPSAPEAGRPAPAPPRPAPPDAPPERRASRARPLVPAERERIEAALRQERGNVRAAARLLDMHRTQLRRLIERGQVTTPGPDPSEAEGDD
ncbi:MAG TPA: sigma 54-interacting transcriptional regulator [Polyangiaceae bacterium]|nr:sigma 54-interacting transcriptional regulator [Polyangiaceae bacterium]